MFTRAATFCETSCVSVRRVDDGDKLMMKIVAIFAVAFVFIASPASAGFTSIDLYWTVDIKGVIDSSTLEFDPDPSLYLYPNLPPPPSTSTCNSDCGTFEVQSTSYNDEYGGYLSMVKRPYFLTENNFRVNK